MNLVLAALIIVAATAAAVAVMLAVRRRAPEGGYFTDSDRATGIFGVLATGFSVLLGFLIFLGFESYDTYRGRERDRGPDRRPADPDRAGASAGGRNQAHRRAGLLRPVGHPRRVGPDGDRLAGRGHQPLGRGHVPHAATRRVVHGPSRRPPTANGSTRPRPGAGPPGPHPRRSRCDAGTALACAVLHLAHRHGLPARVRRQRGAGSGCKPCSWEAWSP